MNVFELCAAAVGLSMGACAVSVCIGLSINQPNNARTQAFPPAPSTPRPLRNPRHCVQIQTN